MRKLRISAISFLNTAPLMWDFEKGLPPTRPHTLPPDLARDFEIEYSVPSQCAEALRAGTADMGIIPAIEFARIPGLVILPGMAIAAKGPVRSILLISKRPLEEVETLAADTSSRTSVALTRVLFQRWFGRIPKFVPKAPDVESMLADCDAALLIGDAALAVDRSQYTTWDLAEEWQRLTGRPFVFAVWVVRMAALNEMRPELDLAKVFSGSRDRGLQPASIDAISREWANHLPMSQADIASYLTHNIDYRLHEENLGGLELFYRYAAECGAIPQPPSLRFLSGLHCAVATL
jgi:chorismate dehydratase